MTRTAAFVLRAPRPKVRRARRAVVLAGAASAAGLALFLAWPFFSRPTPRPPASAPPPPTGAPAFALPGLSYADLFKAKAGATPPAAVLGSTSETTEPSGARSPAERLSLPAAPRSAADVALPTALGPTASLTRARPSGWSSDRGARQRTAATVAEPGSGIFFGRSAGAAPAGAAAAAPPGDADYVSAPYRRPLSPYELKAGDVVNAALITGLNSDLPGLVVAQVTRPAFDHATGRVQLIPQGARVIGRYEARPAFGSTRAEIVWTRIVMPNGRSLDIGAMPGADTSGASGIRDRVDDHIGPIMRAIALSTALTVGSAAAQDARARASGALVLSDGAAGAASTASATGQRFVDRDLSRPPTLEVRPGQPVLILVGKDLILQPYED